MNLHLVTPCSACGRDDCAICATCGHPFCRCCGNSNHHRRCEVDAAEAEGKVQFEAGLSRTHTGQVIVGAVKLIERVISRVAQRVKRR